jgi:glycosyltransferase involved in cell wall biosynthesis
MGVLDELASMGITVWRSGDELRFAPRDKMTPEIRARLRDCRDELFPKPAPAPHGPKPAAQAAKYEFPAPVPPAASIPAALPRVLFASHDLSLTGAPRILFNLVPRLRGILPAVYSPVPGPLADRFREAGVPVAHTLNLDGVDLIVANTLRSAPAIAAAKRAGVPAVWFIHEFSPDLCGNVAEVESVIDYPRAVVFPHTATAANYAALRTHGVHVVPSIVPPAPIRDRSACRESLGLAEEDFVVVTMGRDEQRKGQEDLRAATAGLPVKMFCVQDDPDPWRFYSAADLYVCCSRIEAFPLTLQEAKQYGLPVITTDIPPCRDIIKDGLHYTPGDAADLRSKIERIRADADLRRTLSASLTHLPSFTESVAAYERIISEQPLHVVYHIAGMGPIWREVVTEQLEQLRACGLTTVLATHVGEGLEWVIDEARRQGIALTVCQHEPDIGHCECLAIRLIERLARASDRPILYLHTKAVSQTEDFYHEWRRLMMSALVMRWREHLPELARHDAVGVNWWRLDPRNHFSGNFWLATAEWIRKLPRFDSFFRDRFSCELWIGSREGCNAKSILCSDRKFWAEDMDLLYRLRQAQ